MRDPKRIERIMNTLMEVWKRNPDLRFYQLIHNITSMDPAVKGILVESFQQNKRTGPDHYVESQALVEDTDFEQRMKAYIRKYHPELMSNVTTISLPRTPR